jgi:hypothetical protein
VYALGVVSFCPLGLIDVVNVIAKTIDNCWPEEDFWKDQPSTENCTLPRSAAPVHQLLHSPTMFGKVCSLWIPLLSFPMINPGLTHFEISSLVGNISIELHYVGYSALYLQCLKHSCSSRQCSVGLHVEMQ